jgi:hypothetical protein
VSFAKDPAQGLLDIGWPRYSSTGAGFAQIGNAKNLTGLVVSDASATDASCTMEDAGVLNNTVLQLISFLG